MKIVLGSQSPRRKELLDMLGYSFEIRTFDTDESYPQDLKSHEIAQYIARKKADALIPSLNKDEILITADTIVVLHEEILGKPVDFSDALNMLSKLAGNTHQVITGVCIFNNGHFIQKSVFTSVTFKPLNKSDIVFYLENFKPYDKAGSYGIQDWIGLIGIEKIDGSYTNVVGLPTVEVQEILKSMLS